MGKILKEKIDKALNALRDCLNNGNSTEIKESTESLAQVIHEISAALYQTSDSSMGAENDTQSGSEAETIDIESDVSDENSQQ